MPNVKSITNYYWVNLILNTWTSADFLFVVQKQAFTTWVCGKLFIYCILFISGKGFLLGTSSLYCYVLYCIVCNNWILLKFCHMIFVHKCMHIRVRKCIIFKTKLYNVNQHWEKVRTIKIVERWSKTNRLSFEWGCVKVVGSANFGSFNAI